MPLADNDDDDDDDDDNDNDDDDDDDDDHNNYDDVEETSACPCRRESRRQRTSQGGRLRWIIAQTTDKMKRCVLLLNVNLRLEQQAPFAGEPLQQLGGASVRAIYCGVQRKPARAVAIRDQSQPALVVANRDITPWSRRVLAASRSRVKTVCSACGGPYRRRFRRRGSSMVTMGDEERLAIHSAKSGRNKIQRPANQNSNVS